MLSTAKVWDGQDTQPDYTLYHTEQQLIDAVRLTVEESTSMAMQVTHASSGNYSVDMEVVTYNPPYPPTTSEKPRENLKLLIDFGEHAREFVSGEIGLHLMKLLGNEHDLETQFAANATAAEVQKLLALLRCCVSMKILPEENRSGRQRIETTGDLCERKTGRGVDPNRNWGVDWGAKESDYRPYEENPGAFAFSEPEVMLVRDIATEFKPHVWINVHSGMKGIFMPYDHLPKLAEGPHDAQTLALMQEINRRSCQSECVVGSGGLSVGYLAHGTATDYMYSVMHVPVAMTWEVYGNQRVSWKDCFAMFNPLTKPELDDLKQWWTDAVFHTILLMSGHSAVADLQLNESAETAIAAHVLSEDGVKGGMGTTRSSGFVQDVVGAELGDVDGKTLPEQHDFGLVINAGRSHQGSSALTYGAWLFGGTLVLWCIGRRWIRGGRSKRASLVPLSTQDSSRHD